MRLRWSWSLPALAGGLFLLLARGTPVTAQTAVPMPVDSGGSGVVLDGHAVDAQGRVVAGLQVSLHRVDSSGGARVASAVTDSAGRFHFEMAEAAPGGVLFAAARYQGELYVGPPLRGRIPPGDYTLVVGSPATSASAVMGEATGGTGGSVVGAADVVAAQGRAYRFWAGLIAVVVVGLAALFALRSRNGSGVPERRRLLMELAAVEERLDALRTASGMDGDEAGIRRYEELSLRLRRRALGEPVQEAFEADAAG